MALARLSREIEHTEKDHECTFNAFALGLCQRKMLMQIERAMLAMNMPPDQRFAGFIRRVSKLLDIECSWSAVKANLIALRNQDKIRLQNVMAPILREMSIKLARKHADKDYHKSQTIIYLMSSFNDYRREYNHKKQVTKNEDVFSRHPFIVQKFREVCLTGLDKIKQLKIIDNWWFEQGYDIFLNEMSKPRCWAGDIELARLARYFGIVLDVVRGDFVFNIFGDFGNFPHLHDHIAPNIPEKYKGEIIDCLYDRDIIKRDYHAAMSSEGVDFSVPDFFTISKRLAAIPMYKEVNDFVNDHCMNLKGIAVPPNWSLACKLQLIQRNVIGRKFRSNEYFFDVDAGQAIMRIEPIRCYQEVIEICRAHYRIRPYMVLHNHSGPHWENTLEKLSAEEEASRAALYRSGLFMLQTPEEVLRSTLFATGIGKYLLQEGNMQKKT